MAKKNDAMMIKMDYTTKTATVSKKFAKNATTYGTEEYRLWKEFSAENPGFTMVVKEISKKANKMSYKGLTLQNMRTWMLLKGTDSQKATVERYIVSGISLKTVRDWFVDEKIAGYGNGNYFDYKKEFDKWFVDAGAYINLFDIQFMRKFTIAEGTETQKTTLEGKIRDFRLEKTVSLRDIQNWFFKEFSFFCEEENLIEHMKTSTEATAVPEEKNNISKLPA